MNKNIAIICFIFLLSFVLFGCGFAKETPEQILKKKGYAIVNSEGKTDSYVLTKDKLIEYPFVWGVQNIDIDKYIGKTIDTYEFTIKNHPLDSKSDNNQTKAWVLVCEKRVIGGYSLPDYDVPHLGGVNSLEGKTLEEVTGESFPYWREKWIEKYEK